MGKTIAWGISLLLLLFTGFIGLYNAANEWNGTVTPLQKSVTAGVLLYGVFGLVTAYGSMRRRPWSRRTAIAWGACVTQVPGVAVMAYGGEDAFLSSAITASAAAALIAVGVIWITYVRTRDEQAPAT